MMGNYKLIIFFESFWRDGKQCYLPVIQANNTLRFSLYCPGTALRFNGFGIPEPVTGKRRLSWP